MSNRIDLTQFEGMFEGDHPKHLFEEVEKRFEDGGVRTTPLYLDPQYVNAITLLPELIAELKRCYEEIDYLVKEKNRLIDIAERGGAWDGGIDISDINEDYGACNLCGSIRSGCCEDAS